MSTKYVAYVRVSTEKQGRSGLGMEAQRNIILNYVKKEDIVCWFEEKKSGKDLTILPELEKAMKLTKENDDYVLVIAKADRFRNTQQALDIVDRLTPEKVFFCNIGKNSDKFILTLFFAFAEKERTEISIRTKAALAVLKSQGKKIGRPVMKNKNNPEFVEQLEKLLSSARKGAFVQKKRAIDNEHNRKACIHCYFLRKFKNFSYKEIAKILNKEGYKTQKGSEWTGGSVYRNMKRGYKI